MVRTLSSRRLALNAAALGSLSLIGLAGGGGPVCNNGGPYLLEATGAVTTVILDGSASTGTGPLSFDWIAECLYLQPSFVHQAGVNPTYFMDLAGGCSRTCIVELKVTDANNNFTKCATTVTVEDTTAPAITCPGDLDLTWGDPTDPANTGFAFATDLVDPSPTIAYSDVIIPQNGSLWEQRIVRTWTATDYCLNVSQCVQTITLLRPTPDGVANFDFDINSCPNAFAAIPGGTKDVVLIGTVAFNVKNIQYSSLKLRRIDAAANVSPIGFSIMHQGSPVAINVGECNSATLDGFLDLRVRFDKTAMINGLGLNLAKPGTTVNVLLTGKMKDGKVFAVRDTLVIQ
jgi:hypothetical protein